jgi:pimeloyl-ACP methyl ester carboxylesterase
MVASACGTSSDTASDTTADPVTPLSAATSASPDNAPTATTSASASVPPSTDDEMMTPVGSAEATVVRTVVSVEHDTLGVLTFDARAAGDRSAVDDGRLVVLLHGFPETSLSWEPVMLELAEAGYFAVAFDQRGYSAGARPSAVADYSIDELVDDVFGMVDAFDAETFHVVGHDWGAAVAWAVAGRESAENLERVTTLTALSVGHPAALNQARSDPNSDQGERSGYIDFFQRPGSENAILANDASVFRGIFGGVVEPAQVDAYLDTLGTPEALGAALNWYRAIDLGAVTDQSVTIPTLFMWSTADSALGPDQAEATADFVDARYSYVVLEGVSHWIPDEAPGQVTAALLEHLNS